MVVDDATTRTHTEAFSTLPVADCDDSSGPAAVRCVGRKRDPGRLYGISASGFAHGAWQNVGPCSPLQ